MNAAEQLSKPLLTLNNLSIAYGTKTIVKDISLTLNKGDIGCLLGPSGCGKSTLLRAIAGFEPARTGNIQLTEQIISDSNNTLAPELRNIGMVFQDISLFPHLSIEQNIAFGIKSQPKKYIQARVKQLLTLIELCAYAKLYPHQISGGQQQRVALARALAPQPALILLDEPFSGLDAKLRESLVPQVKAILKKEQVSALMVSHDQGEAFAIADKIAIMDSGEIHQWDSAYNSYHYPASRFVASFIGESKFLPGVASCDYCIETELGKLAKQTPHGFTKGTDVDVLIRVEDVCCAADSIHSATVINKDFHGSYYKYELQLKDRSTLYYSTNAKQQQQHTIGASIPVQINSQNLVIFKR